MASAPRSKSSFLGPRLTLSFMIHKVKEGNERNERNERNGEEGGEKRVRERGELKGKKRKEKKGWGLGVAKENGTL